MVAAHGAPAGDRILLSSLEFVAVTMGIAMFNAASLASAVVFKS